MGFFLVSLSLSGSLLHSSVCLPHGLYKLHHKNNLLAHFLTFNVSLMPLTSLRVTCNPNNMAMGLDFVVHYIIFMGKNACYVAIK